VRRRLEWWGLHPCCRWAERAAALLLHMLRWAGSKTRVARREQESSDLRPGASRHSQQHRTLIKDKALHPGSGKPSQSGLASRERGRPELSLWWCKACVCDLEPRWRDAWALPSNIVPLVLSSAFCRRPPAEGSPLI
jgi:hypothetical protein